MVDSFRNFGFKHRTSLGCIAEGRPGRPSSNSWSSTGLVRNKYLGRHDNNKIQPMDNDGIQMTSHDLHIVAIYLSNLIQYNTENP